MYKRKLTTIEHLFAYAPFSIVSIIARLKGEIKSEQLNNAISRISKKHLVLQSKIENDSSGGLWFTSGNVGEIPVKILARNNKNQWIEVVETENKVPFDFEKRPPVRIILVQSPAESELIVLCHHIICDGLSLAFLVRDLLTALSQPENVHETITPPIPVSFQNFPPEVSMNGVIRFFINRMNKKWEGNKVIFNQEDYVALTDAYWSNFQHKLVSLELTESQTKTLVKKCKEEQVSVNSALTAAFVGAQDTVQGYHKSHSSIGIAADLRNRLPHNPGESLGFYAGMIRLKVKYDTFKEFWENAQLFHKKIKPQFTNKNLFREFLTWLQLSPSIITAINFKRFGLLADDETPAGKKLSNFSTRKDVVMSIMKRDKMDSFDHKMLGTAITNLTKMDFPKTYGDLELDRLILYPGGAFPLGNVNLVVGAVTCSGKLTLVAEYAAATMERTTAMKIKETVMKLLFSCD